MTVDTSLLPSNLLQAIFSPEKRAEMPKVRTRSSQAALEALNRLSQEIAESSSTQKSLYQTLNSANPLEIVHIQIDKMLEQAEVWQVPIPVVENKQIWAVKNWQVLQKDIEKKRYPIEVKSFRTFLSMVEKKIRYRCPSLPKLPSFPKKATKESVNQWREKSWALLRPHVNRVEHLDIHEKIEILPKEIGDFTSLEHLDVSYRDLKEIPEEIGKCRKLIDLRLTHNQLRSIPQAIESLPKLEVLWLSDNQLTQLPEKIFAHPTLTTMDISRNKIRNLPSLKGRALEHLEVDSIVFSEKIPEEFFSCMPLFCILQNYFQKKSSFLADEELEAILMFSGALLHCRPARNEDLSARGKLAKFVINRLDKAAEDPEYKRVTADKIRQMRNFADFEIFYQDWLLSEGIHQENFLKEKLRILGQIARFRILKDRCEAFPNREKDLFLHFGNKFKHQFKTSHGQEGLDLFFLFIIEDERADEIDEEKLIEEVNERFLDTLVRMPELFKIAQEDPQFMERLEGADWGTRRHEFLKQWYLERM